MNYSHFRPVTTQPLIHGDHKKITKIPQSQHSSFAHQLQSAIDTSGGLTISKHAKERLEQRGISINESRWQQIGEKVKEAKKMGVKDSLVFTGKCSINCKC